MFACCQCSVEAPFAKNTHGLIFYNISKVGEYREITDAFSLYNISILIRSLVSNSTPRGRVCCNVWICFCFITPDSNNQIISRGLEKWTVCLIYSGAWMNLKSQKIGSFGVKGPFLCSFSQYHTRIRGRMEKTKSNNFEVYKCVYMYVWKYGWIDGCLGGWILQIISKRYLLVQSRGHDAMALKGKASPQSLHHLLQMIYVCLMPNPSSLFVSFEQTAQFQLKSKYFTFEQSLCLGVGCKNTHPKQLIGINIQNKWYLTLITFGQLKMAYFSMVCYQYSYLFYLPYHTSQFTLFKN